MSHSFPPELRVQDTQELWDGFQEHLEQLKTDGIQGDQVIEIDASGLQIIKKMIEMGIKIQNPSDYLKQKMGEFSLET